MSKKKHPSAETNWIGGGHNHNKEIGESGMRKVKAMRLGKRFKLIPNPNGKGMIEIEIKK